MGIHHHEKPPFGKFVWNFFQASNKHPLDRHVQAKYFCWGMIYLGVQVFLGRNVGILSDMFLLIVY